MSQITYNTITLPLANITEFSQKSVYDDTGDTDYVYTKFDIALQATINTNYFSVIFPGLIGGSSPADAMAFMRQLLLAPRRSLSVVFNGRELIPQKQIGIKGTVDARNGPKPKFCNVYQLTNTTFLVNYSIEAHYWENSAFSAPNVNGVIDSVGLPSNNILYNRWTEIVDIDQMGMTTRSRAGKFVIRSDNLGGLTADQVRTQMVVVGPPEGFLRRSGKYTLSPDGLGISYELVDVEVYKKPTSPAYKAEGYYTESVSRMAAKRYLEADVMLYGAKFTGQSKLVRAAIGKASRIVALRGNQFGIIILEGGIVKNAILETAYLRVGLYENTARFYVKCMVAQENKRIANITGFNLNITTASLDEMVNYTPTYYVRGSAGLLLEAAKYYDPSIVNATQVPDDNTAGNTVESFKPNQGGANWNVGKSIGTAGVNREN